MRRYGLQFAAALALTGAAILTACQPESRLSGGLMRSGVSLRCGACAVGLCPPGNVSGVVAGR